MLARWSLQHKTLYSDAIFMFESTHKRDDNMVVGCMTCPPTIISPFGEFQFFHEHFSSSWSAPAQACTNYEQFWLSLDTSSFINILSCSLSNANIIPNETPMSWVTDLPIIFSQALASIAKTISGPECLSSIWPERHIMQTHRPYNRPSTIPW